MIHVDRDSMPEPATLLIDDDVASAMRAARAHFEATGAADRQQLFKFPPHHRKAPFRRALAVLFAGKCAFCESAVNVVSARHVHRFRPPQEAVGADGKVSREHYWWLAYEWSNLYLSCDRCARAAGAQFPVEGIRATPETIGAGLDREKPVLLDPCRDMPDLHLAFHQNGTVDGLTPRGAATIATYSLNRTPLVEARKAAIAAARAEPPANAHDRAVPYAAARIQVIGGHALERRPTSRVFARVIQTLVGSLTRPRVRPTPTPVGELVVERLRIRDFRGIEDLEIELAGPDDHAPWTMLLGENGYGKTSILQALALVLLGTDPRPSHGRGRKRDPLVRKGAETAIVTADLRGMKQPWTLRIGDDGRFEPSGQREQQLPLAAYGAARIPAVRSRWWERSGPDPDAPWVKSLFDPGTPLTNAKAWLTSLDDELFVYAGRAVRRILLEPDTSVLERGKDSLLLTTRTEQRDVDGLSDGYRAMIALAADIMRFFTTRYESMDAARGVVIIDELGAHLHPAWQMRVVGAFREAFPHLQFVATTHDPLCLRGLVDQREVVVLRQTAKNKVYSLPGAELPSIRGMRVDELLTSEVFGLSSTLDPELEQQFERYYQLLASHHLGPERDAELGTLRAQLADYRQLGATRRERLALEAVDDYIAGERELATAAERELVLVDLRRRLQTIWSDEDPER